MVSASWCTLLVTSRRLRARPSAKLTTYLPRCQWPFLACFAMCLIRPCDATELNHFSASLSEKAFTCWQSMTSLISADDPFRNFALLFAITIFACWWDWVSTSTINSSKKRMLKNNLQKNLKIADAQNKRKNWIRFSPAMYHQALWHSPHVNAVRNAWKQPNFHIDAKPAKFDADACAFGC